MSVNDLDILDLANELSNGEKEAHWRQSASSAYFAVFHCVNRLGDTLMPERNLKTGEHKKLTERLRRCGRQGSAIAYDIGQLKYQRVRADYKINEHFTRKEAEAQLGLARKIMSATESFVENFPTLVEVR